MNQLQEEKMKQKVEKIAERINRMSPEEYNGFMKKIINKVKLLEAEAKVKKEKMSIIQDKPCYRQLKDANYATIIGLTEAGCIIVSAAIVYSLTNEASMTYAGGVVGMVGGFGASLINCLAYENKPLSNTLDLIRIKGLRKKLEKIDKDIYKCNYLQELAVKERCY